MQPGSRAFLSLTFCWQIALMLCFPYDFGSFITFGTRNSTSLVQCYSTSIKSDLFSVLPITRTVTFTPRMRVRHIRVASKNQQKLSARIVEGGINREPSTPISIVLTSDYGGRLSAEVEAFCGTIAIARKKMSSQLRYARSLLLLVLVAVIGIVRVQAQPPNALSYPNVITFGSFGGSICYSNYITAKTLTTVTTRTFTFVPATALLYVICYNNLRLHPFNVQLVGGGLGSTTQTSIVLTSTTGKLVVSCDAYCT
uniref:Transmembrane protein n=1 Tax=Anopheles farauti TaxID=69004 RepID=A0A182Q3R8_9DIPT